MRSKLNLPILFGCIFLLTNPVPIFADEVWEWERFEDNTFESAITISNNPSIYCNEQNQYGTKGCSLALNNGTYTFTFSTDIQVYEVAFLIGAVNNSYSVTWYYADNTSETENKSGQDSSNFNNMYDDFYKSFTDHNAVEENTDKYITAFDVVLTDISLLDTLYWQYDDSTSTGNFATTTTTTSTTTTTTIPNTIGNPTDASIKFDTVENQDGFLVEWESATDGGYSAERYAVAFSDDNFEATNYAVATGNVGDSTALNTYYFFTFNYLESVFGSQYGDFYFKVRADNDTQSLYSGWSSIVHMQSTAPTTTTTLPPKVEEVYVEPEPLPPPPEEIEVDIIVEGVDKTYTQADVNDGTIERDQERVDNEADYGCFMTNAQIERGDCIIIIESEIIEDKEEYEEQSDTEEALFNDDIVVIEMEDEFNDKELIELTEEEILDLEQQINNEAKELENADLEKFVVEQEVFEIKEIIINEDIFVEEETIEDIVEIFEEEDEEFIKDDTEQDSTDEVEIVFEDNGRRSNTDQEGSIELSEEELKVEVLELEEVIEIIEIDIPEATEEEIEDFTAEELIEYEEAKEEAIEEYVEELETEEVVEILAEVNDVGLENIADVSEDVVEVIAQVVEEVITIAQEEELTEEQVEVVAEVLGFEETNDVEIIAEAVKTDENVAQAVDEFVERAVENANKTDQPYTLADATTEIAFESFIASPISVIIDVDLTEINLKNISDDMTQDQKDKAQEVIVPTILVRIVSLALRRFD